MALHVAESLARLEYASLPRRIYDRRDASTCIEIDLGRRELQGQRNDFRMADS